MPTMLSILCAPSKCSSQSRFTGKERDQESGNDYFEARYYSSAMGRFLSPDWSATEDGDDPVPYADLEDPQSLNLYSYVRNNPLSRIDPDGHCGEDGCVLEGGTVLVLSATAAYAGLEVYYHTPAGQRSMETFTSAASANFSSNVSALKSTISGWFSKKSAPAAGPKAADAPGVTAGGQATDEHGNKVGPSGKNQVNEAKNSSKKAAKDAARNAGKGAPVKHPSPTKGDRHYHPTDEEGKKQPNSTHYTY